MTIPRWLAATAAAVAAAVLPACDADNLKSIRPGVTTGAEVEARMGPPGAEYGNEDGSVTWEYSRQPNGIECYMITLGPDRIVARVEQVLTEANLARVGEGMDREQVRRLLGRPGSVNIYERLNEEVWDWRVAGTIPTEEAHFHVHFDTGSGLVKKTSRRVETR
ncbi:MAG TPA: outer membrane protein assembly factor BamE [Rhodocyclaceae bacterium]|nr:outer membrane protein assembly factor BamE [Rhodocyclaceae bacterium]